jgi:prefoldin beta subunit
VLGQNKLDNFGMGQFSQQMPKARKPKNGRFFTFPYVSINPLVHIIAKDKVKPMVQEELRNEVIEFQNLQQQLQLIAMQKQQIQVQLSENDKAQEELIKVSEKQAIYRLIGGIFIPKTAAVLKKELLEEKESLELRKSGLAKQETKLNERFTQIRKKLEAAQKEGTAL